MKQFHIGEVIRDCRQRLGVTQMQLCEGICELATLSKIENCKQQPRRATLTLLLQRLGIAEEQYHNLGSYDELALEELKLAIRNANARFDYHAALLLLQKLTTEHDCDNPIMRQFVLWTQAINGRLVDDEVVLYPLEEMLTLLTDAIHCTVLRYEDEPVEQLLLGLDEVKIIMAIANVHCDMEERETAVVLYKQLLRYIETHCMNFSEKPLLMSMVAYNYSRTLGMLGRYNEELEVVEIGIDNCIEDGRARMLGKLYMNKSCALDALGKSGEAKECGIRAYYLTQSLNIEGHASIISDYLKAKYSWIPN